MGQRGSSVEKVGGLIDPAFWRGKRVLLTGHTGFKGSWLCHWLSMMGCRVNGFALDPLVPNSMFASTCVADFVNDCRGDVRDLDKVKRCLLASGAEIIFHLAAQPLVRHSYVAPIETFAVNVMGTAHLLEAARSAGGVRAIVVVTSDKCYQNLGTSRRYRETDPLGGRDPYSASKACAELATAAYRQSFFSATPGIAVSTARAGNVIGGGDWASERLVPDCVRAFISGRPVVLRRPDAVRPWQHVLEPLSGYLQLAQAMWKNPEQIAPSYNFGPAHEDRRKVVEVVQSVAIDWGEGASWECDSDDEFYEASNLDLDSSKAQQDLGWTPNWNLDRAIKATVEWYRAQRSNGPMVEITRAQIEAYVGSRKSPKITASEC